MNQPDAEIAQVHERAQDLREYAEHFAPRDWDYTRKNDIKHIRYVGDWSGYDSVWKRIGRWLDDYNVFRKRDSWVKQAGFNIAWKHPIIHARASLQTESHLPDGVLDNGGIIVHWEENGEYIQMVQPSVGSLLANIMDAHPDLPEVQAVAVELQRIADRYRDRIAPSIPDGLDST